MSSGLTRENLKQMLKFPPVENANEYGVVAVGDDYSPHRLIMAYSSGIFPWPHGDLTAWFSPDPRCILDFSDFKASRSLKKSIRKNGYTMTFNKAFDKVIKRCATIKRPRSGGDGTWINETIIDSYSRLHEYGYAQSVETWKDGELVGGLYGITLKGDHGSVFHGESMFSESTDSSKASMYALVSAAPEHGYTFIDCQVPNDHLLSIGAKPIRRAEFFDRLKATGITPDPFCPPGKTIA